MCYQSDSSVGTIQRKQVRKVKTWSLLCGLIPLIILLICCPCPLNRADKFIGATDCYAAGPRRINISRGPWVMTGADEQVVLTMMEGGWCTMMWCSRPHWEKAPCSPILWDLDALAIC